MIYIQMIGIDYNKASVEVREKFSFTKTRLTEAVQAVHSEEGVNGCVIISTCNRMEVYISTSENDDISVYDIICSLKNLPKQQYKEFFVHRYDIEAVQHLFSLAAGMQSRIVGEDQIITQVKDALSLSREADCTDKVIEILFRTAITYAKKVKTEVLFHKTNSSAISSAVDSLKAKGYNFNNKKCLVIGNGEMGKLTASALRAQGADVTVTVRQYRSGIVQIPEGCSRINYGDRYTFMPQCDLIVSATSSPNLTIKRQELEKIGVKKEQIYLDLAVPRDIEPDINNISNIRLFDIDSFSYKPDDDNCELFEKANNILSTGVEEFISWYECRDFIPQIKTVGKAAAQDIVWRSGKTLNKLKISQDEKTEIENSLEISAEKSINKIMFALRDSVDAKTLRICLEAFLSAYPEEWK